MMNPVVKKMAQAGASIALALSAGYLVVPWEGAVKDKQGYHVSYLDAVGVPTICYGATGYGLYDERIKLGMKYSENECLLLLRKKMKFFENGVDMSVDVPYTSDYQKAGLISFAYNVGMANFQSSTLLKLLNSGQHEAACDQLSRWIYAKKIKLPGLVSRREDEYDWCMGNVPTEAKQDWEMLMMMLKEESVNVD